MKKFLSTYKTAIILLVAVIAGSIIGIVFQEKATILKPLGDIFLNLLLVIVVPLIFLTIIPFNISPVSHILQSRLFRLLLKLRLL